MYRGANSGRNTPWSNDYFWGGFRSHWVPTAKQSQEVVGAFFDTNGHKKQTVVEEIVPLNFGQYAPAVCDTIDDDPPPISFVPECHNYTRSTIIATAFPPPRHSEASPYRLLCRFNA